MAVGLTLLYLENDLLHHLLLVLLDILLGESGQDLGQVLQPLVDENLFPAKNKAINKRYLLIWIRIPTLPWIKKSAKHCYNTGKTCFLLEVL